MREISTETSKKYATITFKAINVFENVLKPGVSSLVNMHHQYNAPLAMVTLTKRIKARFVDPVGDRLRGARGPVLLQVSRLG